MDADLQRCLIDIESHLNWGPASGWSTADFEALGDRIAESTGVHLSATTLKRVWGRVAYNSSPSPTTLDALARYVGHENWRTYVADDQSDMPLSDIEPSPPPRSRIQHLYWIAPSLIVGLLLMIFLNGVHTNSASPVDTAPAAAPNPASATYSFYYRPVTTGLPNSVIFTYDASAAPTDSVYIQQSWDPTRRERVDRNGDTHTSIYYQPGYYRATLRVGDREVGSRELLIPSDGWTVAIAGEEVPIYLPDAYDERKGTLAVTADQITRQGLSLQPVPPTVWISSVGDFEGVSTDDFRLDTRLRQTYGEGAAACRKTKLYLLLRNSALMVPLSSAGCVAQIGLYAGGRGMDGRNNDLSAFGILDGNWVDLSIQGEGELLSIFLNGELALRIESRDEVRDILGIRYEFAGGGAVDYLRLEGAEGDAWEEDFG